MGHLDAVDSRQDVYTVRTENGDTGHVDIVEPAQVEEPAEVWAERDGYNNLSDAEVDKVNDKDGYGGKRRDEELVPPSNIEEVIPYAKDNDRL